MLKNGGTATVIGMIPIGQTDRACPASTSSCEKKIQGSNMGSNVFRVDMPRYVDLYLQGRLNLDDLVSKRIRLSQVNEAFADLERGNLARSVIVFE
jgi:S-(hydroxymethyl)glutathione dehydrogenase / alcohol dehydrogenase